ncbi:MAG TPA: ABC transporter permease subunit, partial [Acidimicrobiales bacterium]
MTAPLDSLLSTPEPGIPDLRGRRGWRDLKSALMTVLMGLSFALVVVPLLLMMVIVVQKGLGIVLRDFPDWFTKEIPVRSRQEGPGMGPAILGTLLVTGVATVLAIPLGIMGAVYLHEYGGNRRLARLLRFMSYVMTGVPSIVMGLFVYVVFTLRFGLSGLGAALALACLMLPIVIRSTEEMLRLVPDQLREGSYALGTRKSRTIVSIVLPAALPG